MSTSNSRVIGSRSRSRSRLRGALPALPALPTELTPDNILTISQQVNVGNNFLGYSFILAAQIVSVDLNSRRVAFAFIRKGTTGFNAPQGSGFPNQQFSLENLPGLRNVLEALQNGTAPVSKRQINPILRSHLVLTASFTSVENKLGAYTRGWRLQTSNMSVTNNLAIHEVNHGALTASPSSSRATTPGRDRTPTPGAASPSQLPPESRGRPMTTSPPQSSERPKPRRSSRLRKQAEGTLPAS